MTPAQRLAQSRQAIAEHLKRKDRRSSPEPSPREGDGSAGPTGEDSSPRRRGWFGGVERAVKSWWRHHPAHLAVEVATPALQSYARKHPAQLVAMGAGVGVLLAVTRPWRLISATGLAVALLKSSQLPNMLLSMLASHDFGDFADYGTPPTQPPAHPPPH